MCSRSSRSMRSTNVSAGPSTVRLHPLTGRARSRTIRLGRLRRALRVHRGRWPSSHLLCRSRRVGYGRQQQPRRIPCPPEASRARWDQLSGDVERPGAQRRRTVDHGHPGHHHDVLGSIRRRPASRADLVGTTPWRVINLPLRDARTRALCAHGFGGYAARIWLRRVNIVGRS